MKKNHYQLFYLALITMLIIGIGCNDQKKPFDIIELLKNSKQVNLEKKVIPLLSEQVSKKIYVLASTSVCHDCIIHLSEVINTVVTAHPAIKVCVLYQNVSQSSLRLELSIKTEQYLHVPYDLLFTDDKKEDNVFSHFQLENGPTILCYSATKSEPLQYFQYSQLFDDIGNIRFGVQNKIFEFMR